MSDEAWRAVVGHEGLYEVSDQGRVRSLLRRSAEGRVLCGNVNEGGYRVFMLYRGGRRRLRKAHDLVLAAFVGPRPEGEVTRHLNGDPGDNRLANLAYGTHVENAADTTAHGTHANRSDDVTDVHDRHRAWRIRRGRQAAVDVPVATLRVVLQGSAHGRQELTRVLGEKTVEALLAEAG